MKTNGDVMILWNTWNTYFKKYVFWTFFGLFIRGLEVFCLTAFKIRHLSPAIDFLWADIIMLDISSTKKKSTLQWRSTPLSDTSLSRNTTLFTAVEPIFFKESWHKDNR